VLLGRGLASQLWPSAEGQRLEEAKLQLQYWEDPGPCQVLVANTGNK